jgi:uncharacterized protein (TIGR02453 family)
MPIPYDLEPALRFLDELRQNNNKAWFDQHRAEYETARGEYEQFLTVLIDEFRVPDQLQGLTARECIARIYRDIRFSKDKSPYKTNLGALVAPGGWKSSAFGYYVSIEPRGRSMVAGGLYNPTPEQIQRFREAVDEDAAAFKAVTGAAVFLQAFGAVQGERLKTAPKGFDRAHPELELLQLKQIMVVHNFTDQEVVANDFAPRVANLFRAMKPFLNYLGEIM